MQGIARKNPDSSSRKGEGMSSETLAEKGLIFS
jgi:hypothetical protein